MMKFYTRTNRVILSCLFLITFFKSTAQTGWEPMGSGLNGYVSCFFNDADNHILYIGGQFNNSPIASQKNITIINGDYWDSIPSGNNFWGPVTTINKFEDNIYIGLFGVQSLLFKLNNKWIDTTELIKYYDGSNGLIRKIIPFNNGVLLCGNFNLAAGDTAQSIVMWNGTSFQYFEKIGIDGNASFYNINDVAIYHGEIYICGDLFDGQNSRYILKWNGDNWEDVSGGLQGSCEAICLEVFNDELYIGGYFLQQDGNTGSYIQRWNGLEWNSLGNGVNMRVKDMTAYGGNLYICGQFSIAGNENAQYIAKWNGSQWNKIDDSVFDSNFDIATLAVYNEYLYIACGPTINGDTVNRIARRYIGPEEQKNVEDIIKIFPNPVTDNLTLEYNLDKTSNFKFALYDVLGNIVYQEENPTAYGYYHYSLPTQNLAQGLYIARIELNGHTMARKIIKQ